MRAAYLKGHGGAEVVAHGEMPDPTPGEDEALVQVHAAGLNPVEVAIRQGSFKALPLAFPQIMGFDLSGVILAAPPGSGFVPGDAVYARLSGLGAYAELAAVPVRLLAHKPRTIGYVDAASLSTVALTTLQAFRERARLKAGDSVLVQAGAGGIGTVAIQLAKYMGAHVVATASAANQEFLKAMGVDVAIDYAAERFERAGPFDVVYDGVCGEQVARGIASLKPGERYVGLVQVADARALEEMGYPPAVAAQVAMDAPYRQLASERGVEFHGPLTRADGGDLAEVAQLVDEGAILPAVGRVFRLDELGQAYDAVATKRTRGKIVISIEA